MDKKLFMTIRHGVIEFDNYFETKKDATKIPGFSSTQKCIVAKRMLSYVVSGDTKQEYLRIYESTVWEYMCIFCRSVVRKFGLHYLRRSNEERTTRIMARNEARGFLEMLETLIACTSPCKNCLFACQNMYKGQHGNFGVVFEDVTDYDLWIWHVFSPWQVVKMT
jgi:hypothetical protein